MRLPRELKAKLERYGLLQASELRSINQVVHKVERARGKPTRLIPLDLPPGFTGTFIGTASADHIFFPSNAPAPLQGHAVCHEIGHIICDHNISLIEVLAPELVVQLRSKGFTQPVAEGLCRHFDYSVRDEREAELIATYIMQYVTEFTPLDSSRIRMLHDPELNRHLRSYVLNLADKLGL